MFDLHLRRRRRSDRHRSAATRWVSRIEALESRVVLNGAVDVPAQFGGSGGIPLHLFRITAVPEDGNNDGAIVTQTVTFTGFAENPAGGDITNAHSQITIEAVEGGTVIGSASLGNPNFEQDPTNLARANFSFQATLTTADAAPQAVTFRLNADGFGTVPVVRTDNAQPLTATFTIDTAGPTVLQVGSLVTEGTGSVATADVTFSEAIDPATFTRDDLALTRNGSAVTLGTGVTIAQVDPATFRVFGLRIPTAAPGDYVLTVNATGISDTLGNAGSGSGSASFTVNPPPPNGVVGVAAQITGPNHDVVITAIPQDPDNDGLINTQTVVFDGLIERPNRGPFTDTHQVLTLEALQGATVIGSVTWDTSQPGPPEFHQDPTAPNRALFQLTATLPGTGAQTVTFRIIAQRAGQPAPDERAVLLAADTTQALTASFTVDVDGPTLNPLPAITSPRNTPVGTVEVTFSEAIDPASFTTADASLTRDGGAVDVSGVTVTQIDATTFQLSLAGVTGASGDYVLTVDAAGIQDLAGNAGSGTESASFTVDTTGPAVTAISAITSPRTTPVETVDVTFSEAIDPASFTALDLSLTRDGGAVDVSGVTVTQIDATTFRVGGLNGVTATAGAYVLTVNAAGVQDLLGNAGTGSQVANFTVDVAGPTVNPLPAITSPRSTPVSSVDVTFSEAIDPASFTAADLSLTRDGQPVALTDATVTQVDATTFRITGLEGATTATGTYVLTVNGAGILDLAGNAGTGSQVASFVVQPGTVAGPRIVSLQRFGFHSQPTMLVLTFDQALDPARAQDPANYQIVSPGRDRRLGTSDDVTISLTSGVYDPATRTVTLVTAQRLYLFATHSILVRGTGAGAIADTSGNLLDGDGNGQAGGDYTATFDRGILAGPARSLQASLRARHLALTSFATTHRARLLHARRLAAKA